MNSTNGTLFVVVAVVLTFALGMATFLTHYKFKSLVSGLMQSRVLVIGNEIQDNVEKSLSLGLSLQENNTLQGLIERELRSDDLITAIVLSDAAGAVLYSTEPAQQGKKIDKSWLKASSVSKKENWTVNERNAFVAGMPLKNNFGITLGNVALSYSKKPLERSMGIMGNVLQQSALLVLMIAVISASLLLVFAFSRYRKELLAAEEDLAVLIKDLDGVPHQHVQKPADNASPFMQQIHSFIFSVRSTAKEIDSASIPMTTPNSN
ncbi:MAG: hypothetical protein WCP20_09095 [Desulfuromonadales bacterium]